MSDRVAPLASDDSFAQTAMNEQTASLRVQRRVEDLCSAAIRAIAGQPDLHYRQLRLYRGGQRLPRFAAHLQPSFEHDDFTSFRGAADGLALRLRHCDAALHAELSPPDPVERLIFDSLEQLRVESLAAVEMPGLRQNLRHRFEQWSLAYQHSRLTESARGILLYTLIRVCRSRVTGDAMDELTEDLIETTRGMLSPRISHDLAGLRQQRQDQRAYAEHALRIAGVVADLLESRDDERGEPIAQTDDQRSAFNVLFDLEDLDDEPLAVAGFGVSRVLSESAGGYRVFTRAYDREAPAGDLVRRSQLVEYRERLDSRIAALGLNLARLTRALRALLATATPDGWDSAQEEGLIDGRRLAQLISTPSERRLFRIARDQPLANCIVAMLVDCSGSMKQHAETVAAMIDFLTRALERAGVDSEVLGFTTGAWNGGRALNDWQRAGQPEHPGRLNELCHIVFKPADQSWRQARPEIAALLKPELFREGIDGEALDWACARLTGGAAANAAASASSNLGSSSLGDSGSPGHRRQILLVFSDGSPMDSATHRVNDAHYLDHHLRDTVTRLEQSRQVEIFGVGVGLDLSPYYRRNVALDLSTAPSMRTFYEILAMIASARR